MTVNKLSIEEFNKLTLDKDKREAPDTNSLVLFMNHVRNDYGLPPAYLAGGAIRDLLLGTVVGKDYDFFIPLGDDFENEEVVDKCGVYPSFFAPMEEGDGFQSSAGDISSSFSVNKRHSIVNREIILEYNNDDVYRDLGVQRENLNNSKQKYFVSNPCTGQSIDFVVRKEKTIEEILHDFDYSLVQIAFDPVEKTYLVTDAFLKTMETKVISLKEGMNDEEMDKTYNRLMRQKLFLVGHAEFVYPKELLKISQRQQKAVKKSAFDTFNDLLGGGNRRTAAIRPAPLREEAIMEPPRWGDIN